MQSGPSVDPKYAAHEAFVRPARQDGGPGKAVFVVFLFVLAFVILPELAAVLFLPAGILEMIHEGTTAIGTLLQFALIGVPLIAFRQIMMVFHNRGLWSLAGPPIKTVQTAVAVTIFVSCVLLAEEILPPWLPQDSIETVRPIGIWLLGIPFTLVALVIQVTTEEVFFRGYIQQQIASRVSDPFFWMVCPALVFGAAHYFNADGPGQGVLWALWAALLGMACADLTARAGSIGPAIGLHLANNLFALLLFGMTNDNGSGLALILMPYVEPAEIDQSLGQLLSVGGILQVFLICLEIAVLWLGARVAIRR